MKPSFLISIILSLTKVEPSVKNAEHSQECRLLFNLAQSLELLEKDSSPSYGEFEAPNPCDLTWDLDKLIPKTLKLPTPSFENFQQIDYRRRPDLTDTPPGRILVLRFYSDLCE